MLSERFRAAVEAGDLDQAADLFRADAVFRSPVLFKPYEGRDQVAKILQAAERVLGIAASTLALVGAKMAEEFPRVGLSLPG